MIAPTFRGLVVIFGALGLVACSRPAERSPFPLNLKPNLPVPTAPMSHAPLSEVLRSLTQNQGLAPLDPRIRDLLRSYLTSISHVGPTTTPDLFPDREHVLAYLINAHMAWSVALSQVARMGERTPDDLAGTPFPLDGGMTTLTELSTRILKLSRAEPRIGLFLNPGYKGGPPLPGVALEGHSLVWLFAEHARSCGWAHDFWVFDQSARTITLPAFADTLPALPQQPAARYRLILDLVPPQQALRESMLTTCGESLQKCRVLLTPPDNSRRFVAPRFDT